MTCLLSSHARRLLRHYMYMYLVWQQSVHDGDTCTCMYMDIITGMYMYMYVPTPCRYFTCHFQDKVQLYMVLDGHDGSRACDFAQKHIPCVMLSSALEGGEEVTRRAFHNAFVDTEKQFFLSIDPHITRKITLQIEIDVS